MSEPFLPHFGFLGNPEAAARIQAADEAAYLQAHGDADWRKNNSTWRDYVLGTSFSGLGKTLDELVMGLEAVSQAGLDIAAGTEGAAMLELIQRGVLGQAAITNYEDRRTPHVKNMHQQAHIEHINGDLLRPGTWAEIVRWQSQNAPDGLKLTAHRPLDILQWLEPRVYEGAANQLVDMTAPGGAVFSQIPYGLTWRKRTQICRILARRTDVADVFTSIPRDISPSELRFGHVLILKAA